jgi:hypothetical protein
MDWLNMDWLNIPLEIICAGIGLVSIFWPDSWMGRTIWRRGKELPDSDPKRESLKDGGLLVLGMSGLHAWLKAKEPADFDSKREWIKGNGLFMLGMAAVLAWLNLPK